MTRDDIQAEINGLKNLLEQRDNDALEAIDTLVVGVAECSNILRLPQLISDTLRSFYETAKIRIGLRTQIRELMARLADAEE